MSTSPADSTDLPGSAIMLRETQAAMLEFFAVLIRMPHVENGMIQNPGPDGWLNVNVDALTSHGKLAAAIDVLRHLPYIVSTSRNGATICPDYSSYSRGIAYGDGEVCADWREEIFTTPPHVVLLADANTDEGHCLLLDTLTCQYQQAHLWTPFTSLTIAKGQSQSMISEASPRSYLGTR